MLVYLIVCPLIFLGGFVDSVAGGGGLITLPAYLMAGIPVHAAAGTNKVVNGIGSFTASVKYFRGGKIRLPVALWAALGALAGGYAGAEAAKLLPAAVLQGLMLAALPVVAVFLALKRDFGQAPAGALPSGREALLSLLTGLAIGCYDGLVGPGTGTFLIMIFTAALRLDLVSASGCAKVVNLASNAAAGTRAQTVFPPRMKDTAAAAVCSALGNYCGARYTIQGGGKRVRGMIFAVLGLMFVKLLAEFIAAGK